MHFVPDFAHLNAWMLALVLTTAPSQMPQPLTIQPSEAQIGLFYSGVPLTVSADVDWNLEVAVLVSGLRTNLHLRQQTRVWRAFWAPSGEVRFEGIPTLYVLHTSRPLRELAPDRLLDSLGIGYDSFRPEEGTGAALFPELIRLKESEDLFELSVGTIEVQPAEGAGQHLAAFFDLPARAPAGTYRVQVFGFRDRQLVLHREAEFTLKSGPFVAFAGGLAREHGFLYGIVAVVVAIGAGLLVGFIFGSAKGH
jgi:hypothetical protein